MNMRNINTAIIYMLLATLCSYCAYNDYSDKSYMSAIAGLFVAFCLSVYTIGQLFIKGE